MRPIKMETPQMDGQQRIADSTEPLRARNNNPPSNWRRSWLGYNLHVGPARTTGD
jgi:hypothetical protein